MSERMEHTWLEQAAPYALGALEEQERAEFEKHVATCDRCAAEVRELREVASLLATAVTPVSPPSALRDRILSDARTVRPISVAERVNTLAPGGPRAEKEPPARAAGGGGRSMLPWIIAIAASVAAVIFGQQYRGERAARAAAEQALASARVTMDSTGARLAQRDSLIASLVAPDVQAVSVTGTGPSPSARYFLDRRANRIVIAASSLPPAASGRTYQLWGIEPGKPPVGLGTFNTDASGRALVTLTVPPGLHIGAAAVTDEPTGGSPLPTTTPFLAATWKSE